MTRSLAAALGVYDAYNGLVPPNWGHPVQRQRHGLEESGSSDEVIEWYADHDGYRDADAVQYQQKSLWPSQFWDAVRYRYGYKYQREGALQ